MRRTLYKELARWKQSAGRKPLLLYGARQVGKTYLLKEFGREHFAKTHLLNFERDPKACSLFDADLNPKRLLRDLSFHFDSPIDLVSDLLILDEIQACPQALTSLKYFCEELPQLAVAAAGSLLGLQLGESSFPVGKVDIFTLYPLTFEEFLMAVDGPSRVDAFRSLSWNLPPTSTLHDHFWMRLKHYFVVGGMPEAVLAFQEHETDFYRGFSAVRERQESLVLAYLADMAKHSGKQNAMHIERAWRSVVRQLGQSEDGTLSKFKFRDVVPGVSHYSRLAGAIDWLCLIGLVHKIHIASTGRLPLEGYIKENRFKLVLFDVGILGAMAGLEPKMILESDYGSYKGFFVENFVAQDLLAAGIRPLYAWQEKQHEIEFVVQLGGHLVPIEVKAGRSTTSKSLQIFCEKYTPDHAFVLSAKEMGTDARQTLYYCPLYLAGRLPRLCCKN